MTMTKGAMTMETMATRIELEVHIEAPAEKVWNAILHEPDAWWIRDLRVVPGSSKLAMEPRAGGHLIEENDSGSSLLWFTVIAVDAGRSLNLAGSIAPPWGGPSQAFLLIELEEADGATTVKMTNSMHGHVNEEMLPQIESGWQMLLDNGIKRYVETGMRA